MPSDHIVGVMVSVLAFIAVEHGIKHWSAQNKHYI